MPTRIVVILAIAAAAAACSKDPRNASADSPTAPSVLVPAAGDGGAVSGPALVSFPARSEAIDFRAQLENKYANGLGRRPAEVYVDQEGEVVWIGEYDRYRVNGCDHNTATQYVMTQIDGAAPPPVCALRYFPETALYPPRDQVVDFRRQLGSKYQSMGRRAQSAVDADGAAIWTAEYYRYRTSGCDHASAVQKTLTQVDGHPAPESCLVTCNYRVSAPTTSIPTGGGTFIADVERTSGSCEYLAVSESDWITLARPISGSGRAQQTYNVAANNSGAPRTGWIRFQWPGGQTALEVRQSSMTLSSDFFDPATSIAPATECLLKTTSTICTVTAQAQGLPNPVASYAWTIEYAYGGAKLWTQAGSSPSFSFTESCGVSDPNGSVIPIMVKLVATDTVGNTATLFSGQGTQPALSLRSFSCP